MATFTMRIDDDMKREAQADFEAMGLDMATATKMFYKYVIATGKFPFTPEVLEPNKETKRAIKEVEEGKFEGPFNTVEEAMDALNA